jgi:hypothetical protein
VEAAAMKLRVETLLAAVLCVGSVTLAWADPWADRSASAPLVSTRSAARRVFPELADRDVTRATIELQGPEGPPIRIAPGPGGGHQVSHGDQLLGPADPEALDGIWASLRMATTLRAVPRGTDVGVGQGGAIRVSLTDQTLSLALGHAAPAGNGLYGVMEHEGTDVWVVEEDLAWLIEQAPEAWLSHRLLLVEPEEVVSLAWGQQLGLKRGEDGLWRLETGSEPAVLSTEAVDQRMERLFSTRLDPLVVRDPEQIESLRPWLAVATVDGGVHTLSIGGACPGEADHRLIDRGPGLLGCVPDETTAPWNVDDPDSGLLESRLVPYGYGTVLAIELEQPTARTLRRRAGGWVLVEGADTREVSEAEVYRWFSAIAQLEVERADPRELARFAPDVTMTFTADSGRRMTVRCMGFGAKRDTGKPLCARDDGPPRRVLSDADVTLAFDAESFLNRTLLALPPGEVRAVEIMGADGGSVARQSVHLDMGAWRLDAPEHPDGARALDETRLESLLAAASTLRAEAWVEEAGEPQRRITIELSPRTDREDRAEIDVYPDCVVGVAQRLARVSDGACAALGDDLLFDDPVRAWLRTARSLQIQSGEQEVLARREGDAWRADADDDGSVQALVDAWMPWRSQGVRAGDPPGPVEQTWTLRRDDGPTVKLELGRGFVHVAGADWYYAAAP